MWDSVYCQRKTQTHGCAGGEPNMRSSDQRSTALSLDNWIFQWFSLSQCYIGLSEPFFVTSWFQGFVWFLPVFIQVLFLTASIVGNGPSFPNIVTKAFLNRERPWFKSRLGPFLCVLSRHPSFLPQVDWEEALHCPETEQQPVSGVPAFTQQMSSGFKIDG